MARKKKQPKALREYWAKKRRKKSGKRSAPKRTVRRKRPARKKTRKRSVNGSCSLSQLTPIAQRTLRRAGFTSRRIFR